MTIQNNKQISISVGAGRKATTWKRTEIMWSEMIVRFQTPIRSAETYDEYLHMPKAKQDELKDVGGFVGGTFSGTRRKANAIEGRDLVTLDLDNIPAMHTKDIIRRVDGLGCAAAIYSTRKHHESAPRLRVVIPMDMTMEPDEYEPIARKLASQIGIEYCDPTTFEASRLMYWPSVSKDAQYVCEVIDKGFCEKFSVLRMYHDWTDMSQWPQVPGVDAQERRTLAKAEDPLTKKGIVGAFCRTYTITMAMARFLPGVYENTDVPGRLSFAGGSTTGGAVLYQDDRFLFSHHATDPCSGILVNAWDLVRIHKYGDQDDSVSPSTPASAMPSYKAMSKLALEDDAVRSLIAMERQQSAAEVFGEVSTLAHTSDGVKTDTDDWQHHLAIDSTGNPEKTIDNVKIILENDEWLKDKLVTDVFKRCGMVVGRLPWDTQPYEKPRRWSDKDEMGLWWYLERKYRLSAREKAMAATMIVGHQKTINAVQDYLQSLVWDGGARLDTLFTDYLGAKDSPYTRAVARKTLCAACARAVRDGVKFDYMPILIGPQGIGKSTLLSILGKNWFSDSLVTFEGKDAAEMLQGVWINEVGELTAMTKYETNAVKQFLSKTHDIYRAAYSRQTSEYPRKCIFVGTSNQREVLKDETGNRRFWPVDVAIVRPTKNVWHDLPNEVDLIWAEAYFRFMLGETLYLSPELEIEAKRIQEEHEDDDGLAGTIAEFLDQKIPKNWYDLPLETRRLFLAGRFNCDKDTLIERERVCAKEIYVECMGGYPSRYGRKEAHVVKAAMYKVPGWEPDSSPRKYGKYYGTQRGYHRIHGYRKGEDE